MNIAKNIHYDTERNINNKLQQDVKKNINNKIQQEGNKQSKQQKPPVNLKKKTLNEKMQNIKQNLHQQNQRRNSKLTNVQSVKDLKLTNRETYLPKGLKQLPSQSYSIKECTHSSSKSSNNKFQMSGMLMKSKGELSDNDELGDLLDEEDMDDLLKQVMGIDKLIPEHNLLEDLEDQRMFMNSLLDLEID